MNSALLQRALIEIKSTLESAIQTATFGAKTYNNGQRAKEALIRSQKLILRMHEVAKRSLNQKLLQGERQFSIHPPLGQSSPELKVSGLIKAKQQDIVVLFDGDTPTRELIQEGPLSGSYDSVGKSQSERSIVIGIRSQLSSVAKNFDTLMERAFAETLNLRLRLPNLVMGEVYLLPVQEYDDDYMTYNSVGWKERPVPVEKFIRTFIGISGRGPQPNNEELYKYERSALIFVDFQQSPPKIFLNLDQLKEEGYVSPSFEVNFDILSPDGFTDDIIEIHQQRHRR